MLVDQPTNILVSLFVENNMHPALKVYFQKYPQKDAPFMHEQLAQWSAVKPLKGFKVLHHVPVVSNTLLKIACLVEAGAEVWVSNPYSFCQAQVEAINSLKEAGISYVEVLNKMKNQSFDLYFDCGAQLYQTLGRPNIGSIELTGTGDTLYRQILLDIPVISIDRTLTKQLETILGCTQNCGKALKQLTHIDPIKKSWVIFGFGKIGRGLAYYCQRHHISFCVIENDAKQRHLAQKLKIITMNPKDLDAVKSALDKADIVLTATGTENIMQSYKKQWFDGKILANMGVLDEFGTQFEAQEVLNHKKPINFVLEDPTPIQYIDPEFYLHNMAALMLLEGNLNHTVQDIPIDMDENIIKTWCKYHSHSAEEINTWFVKEKR